jgi:hypothetical protein
MPRRFVAGTLVVLGWIGLGTSVGSATSVIVPDDAPSVQAAISSGADSVLIREGTYPEHPLITRPIVLQGIGLSPRPELDGLDITNQDFEYFPPPWPVTISGINFVGRVNYATVAVRPRGIQLAFHACSLGAGFYQTQSLDPYDIGVLSIRNCYMGGVSNARADRVNMDADTISSGPAGPSRVGTLAIPLPPTGAVNWDLSTADITHCVFRGGGLALTGNPYAAIWSNRMEDCASGITVLDAAATRIDSNTVVRCRIGIFVTGSYVEILDNDLIQCGIGVYSSTASVHIAGNQIVGSGNQGILSEASDLVLVERNVVVGGGAGPLIETGNAQAGVVVVDAGMGVTVQRNTVVADSGSGIVLDRVYPVAVERNIGFGNRGWGLSVEGASSALEPKCNDWFANGLGSVKGLPLGSTDVSVDPLFCKMDSADVRLNSASPLLADTAACGLIGALGLGCGETPTLVQRFAAAWVSAGVRVVWEVASGASASEIWVERSEGTRQGPWTRPVTERSIDNRAVVELDPSAVPDRKYWYRLMAQEGRQTVVIGASILVEAPAPLEFRLVEVGPNPGSGPVRIVFALKQAAAIEIDVFDVQGRKMASPGSGVWAAGTHEVQWSGRTRGGETAPAGMYFLRYTYPGGQDRRAVVRMR